MNNASYKSAIGQFRLIALTEGVSYLILLFIAMPLKYFAELPEAVKYIGWIHGVLFILYMFLLTKVWIQYRWSIFMVAAAVIAALLPFGTFVLDKNLKGKSDPKSKNSEGLHLGTDITKKGV